MALKDTRKVGMSQVLQKPLPMSCMQVVMYAIGLTVK